MVLERACGASHAWPKRLQQESSLLIMVLLRFCKSGLSDTFSNCAHSIKSPLGAHVQATWQRLELSSYSDCMAMVIFSKVETVLAHDNDIFQL
jgi:hypothetical protein